MFERLSQTDQENCRAIFQQHGAGELDYVCFPGRGQPVQMYGEFSLDQLKAIVSVAEYLSLATHLEGQLKLGFIERRFELRG